MKRLGEGRKGGREGGRAKCKKGGKNRRRKSEEELRGQCSLCFSSSDMVINDDLHVLGGGEGGTCCVVTGQSHLK